MKVHFLVGNKEKYMKGLHRRACDPTFCVVTRGREKNQGSFKRKDVNCGNCKRTDVFLKA